MPESKPNLLWIVTTQWRGQALGHEGDPNARTPALDALARRSFRFEQAFTPHPFGPFARAAMLTGTLCPENGVRDYFDPLPPDSRTIAHRMRERGYHTAYFGKWHLAPRDPAAPLVGPAHAKTPVPPERRGGFAFWEGFESGFQLNDPWLQGTDLPEPVSFPGYQADVVFGRAAAYLSRQTAPWFAIASVEPPHPPYAAPASGIAPPAPESLQLRGNVPSEGPVNERARRELAGYYAHIEATDRAIGRLIESVPPTTVIVVTSVHGDMHGSHGHFRKGWPHEESVRVPLLIAVPGSRPRSIGVPASLADLPRITEALAANGQWVLPSAQGVKLSMPSVVSLPDQCDRIWRGVRTAGQKLIVDEAGLPWLYFNLWDDPLEMNNLAGDPASAEAIAQLRTLL